MLKRPMIAATLLVSAAVSYSPDTNATTYFEKEFICPIGGEKFKSLVVDSNSSFGQRPDGRPYSPLPVYPITECPGNGFLMFDDDLSEDELRILAAAIATDEYETLREADTPYRRLAWLKQKIGRGQNEIVDALLVASWETDDNSERKAKYQAQFIEAADAMDEQANERMRILYSLRAANAARELSRFEDARIRFDALQGRLSLLKNDDEKDFVLEFIAGQRMLIAEENDASEPLNLLPDQVAAWHCKEKQREFSVVETARCRSEEVRAIIGESDDDEESSEYEISATAEIDEDYAEAAAEAVGETDE